MSSYVDGGTREVKAPFFALILLHYVCFGAQELILC